MCDWERDAFPKAIYFSISVAARPIPSLTAPQLADSGRDVKRRLPSPLSPGERRTKSHHVVVLLLEKGQEFGKYRSGLVHHRAVQGGDYGGVTCQHRGTRPQQEACHSSVPVAHGGVQRGMSSVGRLGVNVGTSLDQEAARVKVAILGSKMDRLHRKRGV